MTRVASRHRTTEVTSWHEIGSRAVRDDRSGWVGIPSSFVEVSLEIHASVSLHMHKGMQCYITPLLHFELTRALLFGCSFVLFPPTPLIVFLVAMKKCAMPLSEPLDDHRPRNEMVRRSWHIRGGGGWYRHSVVNYCYIVARFWGLYTDSFSSYSIHLLPFFIYQSCKGIKDVIWEFTAILGWKCFPGPVEIVTFPRQSVWRT